MGAGHAHSHRADRGDGFEVARGPRAVLLASVLLAAVAALVGVVALWPSSADVDKIVDAVPFAAPGVTFPTAVIDAVADTCPRAADGSVDNSAKGCGVLEVTVHDGAGKGDKVSVQVSPQVTDSGLAPGDRVRLQRTPGADGADPSYGYFGTERTRPFLVMGLLFALLVVVVARWRGLFALLGLGFSGLVIWKFMLPALLLGESGLLVGLCGSAAIMVVVLYLTHGPSVRTSAALAGTLAGLAVTAGIGVVAVGVTRLTGVSDDSAGILSTFAGDLSFQGLIACATIVAGLGVLNDVTITQASSVWEVRSAAPTMSRAQVFASGMRIGRDHIASTIYTIVFAYAGSALAVLLILQLYGVPFDVLLTTEEIGEEIVRTLASAIGLVLAVPLTTGIAALTVPGASSLSE
ncbi:YibE/F family protein [Nocardioides sp. CN2-186]|uniref:YibE/F family protein n=1 Tax=Nocardioides tweenelious TaxID=3156607 RepID=UPI0032B35702